MTVNDLIERLQKLSDKDKIVLLTDPKGIGWDNIGEIIEIGFRIEIRADGTRLFSSDN